MNVEIGTEAAQFPEKEYIIGIFLAVQSISPLERSVQWTIIYIWTAQSISLLET